MATSSGPFSSRMTTSPASAPARSLPSASMKAEKLLAELNRLRSDLDKDPTDLEWFTLHHVFCFVSYKTGEFQKYLDEAIKPGDETPED